ncbi:MAG: PAS domain S-box protein [Promethearchaeota archaeon]
MAHQPEKKENLEDAYRNLKDSEELYKALIRTSPDAVIVSDLKGNVIDFSERLFELTGFTKIEEIKGKSAFDFIHPDDHKIAMENLQKTLVNGYMRRAEYKLLKKDGTYYFGELNASIIKDSDGNPKAFLATIRDITAQKLFNNALRKSEEQYKNLYENALVGLWTSQIEDGKIIRINRTAAEILGFEDEQDVVNKFKIEDFFSLETRRNFISVLNKEKKVSGIENNFIDKNGINKTISVSAKIIREKNQIEGVFIDITEMKDTQKKLSAASRMIQLVMDNIPQYIFWKDKDSVYMGCNKNFADIAGLDDPEEIVGKTDNDLPWKKEEIEYFRQVDRRVMENDTAEYFSVEPMHFADGKEYWVDKNKIPLHDHEGNVIGILGTFEDITEQIEAESQIEETEEKFRTLTDQSLMGICILQDDQIKYVNEKFAEVIGTTREEMKKWTTKQWINSIHPDDRKFVVEQARKKQAGQKDVVYHYQFRGIHKSGRVIWADLHSKTINYRGRPADFITILDITDTKRAEEELRKSEQQYRTTINSLADALHVIDSDMFIILVNHAFSTWLRRLGIDENILGKTVFEAFPFLPDKVRDEYLWVFENGKALITEEHSSIKGKLIIAETRKIPIFYEGKVHQIITIVRDITARKAVERQLRNSEKKYRDLFDKSPYGIVLIDSNGIIKEFNTKIKKLLGYKLADFKGKNYLELDVYNREIVPELRARLAKVVKGEEIDPYEVLIENKNGKKIWLTSHISNVDIESERFIQIMVQDITDRKLSKIKLMESEEKYRDLFENSPSAIVLMDLHRKVRDINKKTIEIFGYSKEEILNQTIDIFNELALEDTMSKIKIDFNVSSEGMIPKASELLLSRKDGTQFWGYVQHSLIKIENEGFIQIIIQDISELKETQKALMQSEEKYRSILENIKEAYFEVDLKGNFTFVNDSFTKVLGYSREEALNMNYADILDQRNARKVSNYYSNIYKSGIEHANFEYEAIKKNGEVIYVDTSAYLRYDSDGNKIGFGGFGRDITERKRAEKQLEESEIKFRSIFDAIPDIFFLVARDSTIIEYKAKEEDLYILPEKFLGERLLDMLPKEIAEKSYKIIQKTISTTKPQVFEYSLSIQGVERFFEARHLYFTKDQVAIFIRDITGRKKAELIIQEEMEKLKQLDELRKNLISRVSHELKTPLMSISGAAELLNYAYRKKIGKEASELVEIIEKGGSRLNKLVENLLDISRLDYDRLILSKEDTDFCKVIKVAVEELTFLAKERKIKLLIKIPDNLVLNLDKIRIMQVITNLLSNAIKNTPPKGRIDVLLEQYHNWAILSVADTGIGLTSEEIKKIFTRFGKIERYGEGLEFIDIQGSGLGLYLSKQIVELHGGKLWVESDGRHKGATFTLRLPMS